MGKGFGRGLGGIGVWGVVGFGSFSGVVGVLGRGLLVCFGVCFGEGQDAVKEQRVWY